MYSLLGGESSLVAKLGFLEGRASKCHGLLIWLSEDEGCCEAEWGNKPNWEELGSWYWSVLRAVDGTGPRLRLAASTLWADLS